MSICEMWQPRAGRRAGCPCGVGTGAPGMHERMAGVRRVVRWAMLNLDVLCLDDEGGVYRESPQRATAVELVTAAMQTHHTAPK